MRPDPSPETAPDAERVRDLLDAHVPLALIADLTADAAVSSQEILEKEGLPEDTWWEGDERDPAASSEPRP